MTFVKDIPELIKSDKFFYVWENELEVRPTFADFEKFFILRGMQFIDEYGNSRRAFGWDADRGPLKNEDLKYFPGLEKIIKEVEDIYGTDNQISYMSTGPDNANRVHAIMHNDKGDVLHFACEGQVEWRLIHPNIIKEEATEEEIVKLTLNAGDVLWFRSRTSHETTPLSARAGIIWLNDLDELQQNPYYTA